MDVNRSAARGLRRGEDDEALAIGRQIQRWIMVRELNRRFGPLAWCARREGVGSGIGNHHDPGGGARRVEQFFGSARPNGKPAAASRDLPLTGSGRWRKGPHVDLVASRLGGGVGQPMSIG